MIFKLKIGTLKKSKSDSKLNKEINDSNFLINKFKSNIKLIKENEKGKTDSWTEFFLSKNITISMILYYLDEMTETGPIELLINTMMERFKDETYFYIPQYCSLLNEKKNLESLQTYLLEQCLNKIKFSLYVYWMVSSYAELQKNIKYSTFLSTIEMAMVNGSRYTGGSSFQMIREKFSEEEVYEFNINKQFLANYFNKCIVFYKDLKLICEKLKNYPKEDYYNPQNERKNVFKGYLKILNERIHSMYNEEEGIKLTKSIIKGLYRGIILPFDDSESIADEDCNLIVNLNINNSICLSNKARVPCKIVFECVKAKDLIDFDNNYIQVNNDDKNSNEDINQNDNDNNNNNDYINVLGSVDDFLKDSFDEEKNGNDIKEKEKKEEKIKEIVKEIKYYNENQKEKPKKIENIETLSLNRKDSEIPLADFKSEYGQIFGISWKNIVNEIKLKSNYKNFNTLQIKSFIAKANDDLRQESLTMQLLKCFSDIFKKAEIPLKLKTYEIIITSSNSGLIEFIPNTLSIDAIKKKINGIDLNCFFRSFFNENFEEAQKNFCESLAGYSLITYILNIKDRHNGNILIDINGNIIHIDFGFILGISPGNLNFENAPFKMTKEYIDILDGQDSNIFQYFKSIIVRGFIILKHHFDVFAKIIDIMAKSKLDIF